MTATLTERAELSAGRRILRNAASLLFSGAAGEVLTTYAVGLAAIALGPAGFGRLAEAQAFIDPFDALAGFGLIQVSITLAASRGCDSTLRSTVLVLRLGFAAIATSAAFMFALTTDRASLVPLLLILAINSFATPFDQAATLPFQCDQAMHRLLAIPFIASVVRIGTTYLAYWLLATPVGFQASAAMAGVASATLSVLFARHYYGNRFAFDRAFAKRLLAMAWPAATLEVVVMIYCRGSYFLLHNAGPAVQGEFAAADKLVKPILTLAGIVTVSSLPTVAGMAAREEFAELLRIYRRSALRIFVTLAPVALGACLLMPYLLARYVPAYAGAALSFRILTVGALFMFMNQLSSAFIVSLGRFRLIMMIGFVNLVVYFAIALLMIPVYQAPGAAFSTAIMEALNTLMQSVAVVVLLKRALREKASTLPR